MTLGERAELYCGIELPLFLGCGRVCWLKNFHWVACKKAAGEKIPTITRKSHNFLTQKHEKVYTKKYKNRT